MAETSKTGVAGMSHDDVVENFDFQKLTRSDEITGNLDIRFEWSRIPEALEDLWVVVDWSPPAE